MAVLEGDLERVAETLLDSVADGEAIDDHFDGVAHVLVERDFLAQFAHRAVDLDPHEAGSAQVAQLLAIFALAVAHDRREHVDARAVGPGHDAIDDLLNALLRDLAPAVVAKRVADAREQQAQVVVNFGDGGRPSSAGCARWSFVRSRSPAKVPRSNRRPASPSAPGTGARKPKVTRRSGAGLRRRWCRRRARTCPSPKAR